MPRAVAKAVSTVIVIFRILLQMLLFSFPIRIYLTFIITDCHSERSEDELLRTPSEKSRLHGVAENVNVTEILRYTTFRSG